MTSSISIAVLGTALFTCGAAFAADSVPWTYSGEHGPDKWAQLSPEFAACNGKDQSPIDLTGFIRADLAPIRFSYRPGGQEIVNNGHTVQVNYGAGSSLTVDGIQFELKQFHFHAPSENRINGKSYPLEAHLVHADKNGNLAVVAVMYKQGAENKALAKLWPMIPGEGEKGQLPSPFAAANLLPARHAYYRFSGSLTTPPCTEGVRWLVMKSTELSASKEQIEAFTHAMHHPNNRPVQPINARVVLK